MPYAETGEVVKTGVYVGGAFGRFYSLARLLGTDVGHLTNRI